VGIAVPNNLVPEAKRRLQELVQNQHVRIEIHTIVPDVGVVGSVFLEGRDIGAQLVSEGLAVTTPQMRAMSPSHRSEVLVAAQKKAISESAGFWGNAGER
jgi:endonuclease YncB( thermonuclease family)